MSFSVPAMAQAQGQTAQQVPIIRQISVVGNERVEPETIASYLSVAPGEPFDPVKLDESLKTLFATGLFSDVELSEVQGALLVRVVENPIINRIVFEGNKRLDREELLEEVRLRPRMVFTRAKVRSDVQRMLELYRRSGRFAAIIEPKVVQLEQNRVDLLFEVQEGPKTKVSSIKFIGNEKFSDGDLRDVLATKQARWWKIFTSNDTFDPDRLAYDQQVLRQHYLNEGYADFRTISAVSELTPDRKDFFITFSVDEGEIYEFGKIDVDSEIRDVNVNLFRAFLLMREGDIYNAEAIEKTIEALSNAAGLLGYAFVDVRPQIKRDRENRKIDITFRVLDAPRVYVERINITGNVRTLDRVIRREIRLQEGDAFNSALVTRSENRLNRLNFFREVDIEQIQGSQPDRMVLDVTVQEQATGELNLGAGFSSLENFIFDFSIRERNLMGKGQDLRLGLRLSGTRQEIDLGFTEPYFGGRNVAAGFDIFARKINSSRYSYFDTTSIGASLRAGMALNEFWTLSTRYTLRQDDVKLVDTYVNAVFDNYLNARATAGITDQDEFDRRVSRYDTNNDGVVDVNDFDTDGVDGISQIEKQVALSRGVRDSIGKRWQSIVGYTVGFNTLNSIIRPTRGHSFYFSQDFAGLGGNVRYLRSSITNDNYWTPWEGWTFRIGGEAGIIHGVGQDVRLSDKFFIGGPRIRGFDTSGMGPRDFINNQSIGGTAYYIGRGELFFPLGDAALESGINASAFVDVGSLFRAQEDVLEPCAFTQSQYDAADAEGDFTGLDLNCMSGNSAAPRISVGIGFSWQSPFGPFRIDLSKQLQKQLGDRTQTLQFNVGTTF
ncbi:outer membrane protein assembly factor BamA [Kordiimonas aestuarii]|uniref:outer membrane protein assembly factor BamA n=1 Tax=Kordiimonas aestuarii TaxID=1005925 RepID=UPI0021CF0EE5|nr:outer membrane protein assembly factor BamA [Kordiimonas aestuarii]